MEPYEKIDQITYKMMARDQGSAKRETMYHIFKTKTGQTLCRVTFGLQK